LTAPRRPPGRYDDARRSSRLLVIAAAVVVGALIAVAVYALYERHNEGRLPYEVRGYEVLSDTAVRVSFEVSLARGERGECKLRARGRTGEDVGEAVIPVGPGRGGALVTSYELPTTSRASTGEVVGCLHLDAS
jgi:hypothetical protein